MLCINVTSPLEPESLSTESEPPVLVREKEKLTLLRVPRLVSNLRKDSDCEPLGTNAKVPV
jgi:hypothetical protein